MQYVCYRSPAPVGHVTGSRRFTKCGVCLQQKAARRFRLDSAGNVTPVRAAFPSNQYNTITRGRLQPQQQIKSLRAAAAPGERGHTNTLSCDSTTVHSEVMSCFYGGLRLKLQGMNPAQARL